MEKKKFIVGSEDGSKYGKYFIDCTQLPGGEDPQHIQGPWVSLITPENFPEGNAIYSAHWVIPGHKPLEDNNIGHPMHCHKDAELLFFIGTDPEHPEELGGVASFSMGEEREVHTITRTCCLVLPPYLVHGNYYLISTEKPWIFFRVNGPEWNEKLRTDLLTEEEKSRIHHWEHWAETGFEDIDYVPRKF